LPSRSCASRHFRTAASRCLFPPAMRLWSRRRLLLIGGANVTVAYRTRRKLHTVSLIGLCPVLGYSTPRWNLLGEAADARFRAFELRSSNRALFDAASLSAQPTYPLDPESAGRRLVRSGLRRGQPAGPWQRPLGLTVGVPRSALRRRATTTSADFSPWPWCRQFARQRIGLAPAAKLLRCDASAPPALAKRCRLDRLSWLPLAR